MPTVTLRLPDVKEESDERPKKCPHCDGEIFQRWGAVKKPVKDTILHTVKVYRYHCCSCRHTFRHYPAGIDRADQTQRLRKLAALGWVLGLSLRGAAILFAAFGVDISHMSVWRDTQEEALKLRRARMWQPVRVLGLDGAYVRGWGETQPVLVAIDLGNGKPITVGYVNEYDPQAVRKWLEPLVQRLGVSVIVSDDLHSYRIVAKQLDLEHQVCQFHVRRWVGRTLRQLHKKVPEEWLWVVEEVQQMITELPQDGSSRLFELWKQVRVQKRVRDQPRTPLDQLRNLLIRLSESWKSYCTFYYQPEVPWTNNGTEQAIGRMKVRGKSVRGYKTWEGMQAGLMLSGNGIA